VWTADYRLVLDGPRADRAAVAAAARTVAGGGHFGYRFHWPPMRVGAREVVWHRALAFVVDAPAAAPRQLDVGAGVLVASRPGAAPIHLWPRADARPPWTALERGFAGHAEARHDVRKLLDARARLGEPLPPSLATRLVSADRDARWAAWRAALPGHAADPAAARTVTAAIDRAVARREPPPDRPRTFARTATRAFEERYWRTIAGLAHATWRAKNNADGVAPAGPGRDLDGLADELARRHQAAIARARHGPPRAVVGHHWFRWTTEFDMPWSHGWVANQLHGPQRAQRALRDPRPRSHARRSCSPITTTPRTWRTSTTASGAHGAGGHPSRRRRRRRQPQRHRGAAARGRRAPADERRRPARPRRLAGAPDRRGVPGRQPRRARAGARPRGRRPDAARGRQRSPDRAGRRRDRRRDRHGHDRAPRSPAPATASRSRLATAPQR
jgi:hypothetical protein